MCSVFVLLLAVAIFLPKFSFLSLSAHTLLEHFISKCFPSQKNNSWLSFSQRFNQDIFSCPFHLSLIFRLVLDTFKGRFLKRFSLGHDKYMSCHDYKCWGRGRMLRNLLLSEKSDPKCYSIYYIV